MLHYHRVDVFPFPHALQCSQYGRHLSVEEATQINTAALETPLLLKSLLRFQQC